jgi:hypothetical protein
MAQQRHIGRIVDAWSTLDATIEQYIWFLLGIDKVYGKNNNKKNGLQQSHTDGEAAYKAKVR